MDNTETAFKLVLTVFLCVFWVLLCVIILEKDIQTPSQEINLYYFYTKAFQLSLIKDSDHNL